MSKQAIREAISATPPVSVSGLTLLGFPLSEWVLVGTAIYTAFLIIDKMPTVAERIRSLVTWIKEKTDGKESRE